MRTAATTTLLHRKLTIAAFSLGLVTALPSAALADNPIVQTNYTSDPAPFVYGGTVYLITTHDENVAGQPCSAVAGYTLCRWYGYSSTDMVNWTDHGTVASFSTFSWASTAAWAPQAIPRNGKFFIYVPVNNNSGATNIGVGVSTSPIGPFEDAIGKALVTGGCSGATGDIDPTVFIDDDGQAYLYFGRSVPGYVKLNADMISYSGSIQCPTANTQTFGPAPSAGGFPTQYEEGPWIMKHGGGYFLAYAANGVPEDISYSKATAPGGPFTYGGTIMKATGASFTNHTGIIDFSGHSYFFYHNGALQKGGSVPSNGDGYHRSACLEEFSYDADGSFPTITPTTAGPKPIANLNPFLQTEAETIAWESGVQTEATSDTGGGMDVTSIQNGDYIKVKSVDFGTGAVSFDARVASATSGGSIELRLDSQTGTLVGTCAVQGTGGAQTWATKSCAVSGAVGVHDLYLKFTGGSGDLFNFNWWKFAPRDPLADAGSVDAGPADAGARDGASPEAGSSRDAGTGATGGEGGGVATGSGGVTGTGGRGGTSGASATSSAGGSGGGQTTGGTGGGGSTAGGATSDSSGGGGLSASGGMAGGSTGAVATGGTASGSAGASGAGATAGGGGTATTGANGGVTATGGSGGVTASGVSGGATTTNGGDAAALADQSPGGCACQNAPGRSNSSPLALMVLLLLSAFRRSSTRERT